MPDFNETCRDILRQVIAKGDDDHFVLAERAIDEYLDVTPAKAKISGSRLLQSDVLAQRDAVLGSQRKVADAVNSYLDKKLHAQ